MKKHIVGWTVGMMLVFGAACALAVTEPSADDSIRSLSERVAALEAQVAAQGIPLVASWQHGIRLESPDRAVRLRLGGRVQHDMAAFDAEAGLEEVVGRFHSGAKFRRGRIYVDGVLFEHGLFRVEYDFAGGVSHFRDAHLGIRNVPFLGTVRVGRMLEAYSFEQLSGNNFHAFMERGLPAAFNVYWNNGVGLQNSIMNARATWAVTALQSTNTFGDSNEDSGHHLAARLTAAPVYADNGRQWLHLGVAGVQRKPDAKIYAVSSRPESSVAPRMVSTGDLSSDRVDQLGLELAAAHGPLSVQAEWHRAKVSLLQTEEFPYDGNAVLDGMYVSAGYMLTGEHRPYNRQTGVLGRVVPRSYFRGEGHGWGAWELGVRWSELDLNDGPVSGGELRDLTVGLNWYLNPNMRMMWNVVRAERKDAGSVDIVQMRAQFDF